MKPADMKLKVVNKIVLEKCTFDDAESTNMKLLGSKPVEDDLVKYEKYIINETNQLDPDNTFIKNFGLDTKFYYQLMIFKETHLQHNEVGLGCVVEEDGQAFLHRFIALTAVDHEGNIIHNTGVVTTFLDEEYTHIHVTPYPPQKALQLMIDANTIPCTNKVGPTSVYMEDESCLGVVDGNLQSVPFNTVFSLKSFAKSVIDSLAKTTRKLSLRCSSLFCTRIESNILVLHSTSKKVEEEGAVIYDKKSKSIKLFDGTKWRSLTYDEDT